MHASLWTSHARQAGPPHSILEHFRATVKKGRESQPDLIWARCAAPQKKGPSIPPKARALRLVPEWVRGDESLASVYALQGHCHVRIFLYPSSWRGEDPLAGMSASVMGHGVKSPGLSCRWLLASVRGQRRSCQIIRSEEVMSRSFDSSSGRAATADIAASPFTVPAMGLRGGLATDAIC